MCASLRYNGALGISADGNKKFLYCFSKSLFPPLYWGQLVFSDDEKNQQVEEMWARRNDYVTVTNDGP